MRRIHLLLMGAVSVAMFAARAQTIPTAAITQPPMGWSSWNSFSNTVDSENVMEQAKAMLSTGLHRAGYVYVDIDEGWWLGKRDADGNIVVEPAAWPAIAPGEHAGDMSNIVRYIHGLGLKAGIYTDAGESGCSMYPDLGPKYMHTGSEGHYDQDFLQFARWGFDYVKVDWCGGDKEKLDPAVQYAEIAKAIARAERMTGHAMFYSICNWGKDSPWTWAPNVGGSPADIWRTSGDIVAPVVANSKNADRTVSFPKMLANFDDGIHPEAQHTGYYNDPDMMVIGMPGLDDRQNRVHMGLWAISGAPLLIGADLTRLSEATLATLSNKTAIAIDQDPLGLQGVKVAESGPGLEVWSKRLVHPGERAVVLLNRTANDATIAVAWSDLGLAGNSRARVMDVWTAKEAGAQQERYSATVPAGDAVLLLVRGEDVPMTRYAAAGGMAVTKDSPVSFEKVAASTGVAAVAITYRNPDHEARYAELYVNGQDPTRIAFPPTGGEERQVWIEAVMNETGAKNVLRFSSDCAAGPVIGAIQVQ